MDADDLGKAIVEHYDRMDSDTRALLPLRKSIGLCRDLRLIRRPIFSDAVSLPHSQVPRWCPRSTPTSISRRSEVLTNLASPQCFCCVPNPVQGQSLLLCKDIASMKEATARIKINKLLEAAGWRFFPDSNGPANICWNSMSRSSRMI